MNDAETPAHKHPYLVLARKYRPQSLDDVIGQDVLIKTITNALSVNKFPHAVLLFGIRGVGKTTIARLIAKCLNCESSDMPVIRSCNVCAQCTNVVFGNNRDVLEIDAASNTGVDDMRIIIDDCKYQPVAARYRVYIIDEVHMLSNSAFNALLKTLEEPPPYVKFIFATTEMRKIPLTIISRCQLFTLRKMKTQDLVIYYRDILKKENIAFEDEAINQIAMVAAGSMRDGLSILDQAITLCKNTGVITQEATLKMLGMCDRRSVLKLLLLIIDANAKDLLEMIASIYAFGSDPNLLTKDLLALISDMLKLKCGWAQNEQLYNLHCDKLSADFLINIDLPDLYKILQCRVTVPFLLRAWQVLCEVLIDIRESEMPEESLEVGLIKLMYINIYETPEDLMKLLDSIEAVDNANKDVCNVNKDVNDNALSSVRCDSVNERATSIDLSHKTEDDMDLRDKLRDKIAKNPLLAEIMQRIPECEIEEITE